jgi:hypothetical protein
MTHKIDIAEELELGLQPKQQALLASVRQHLRVAVAHAFGDRLSPLLTDHVVRGCISGSEVLAHLEGVDSSVSGLPSTPSEWITFAKQCVGSDELAVRNLEWSDAENRRQLEEDAYNALSREQRINLSRSGKLENTIRATVESGLYSTNPR